MLQMGFFDLSDRYASLDAKKDPLVEINAVVPWEEFRPALDRVSITKAGDVNLRRALCQAATVMMHRGRSTWLRTWAAQLARRRGAKRAMVALARLIAVILHRMWVDDTDFRSDIPLPHAV